MSDNFREFFRSYQGSNPAFACRICNEVMRNGIIDMGTLCEMLKKEPKKLLQMRNIGSKSFDIISAVCSAYINEKDGISEQTYKK